ncbi:hypothetical protein V8F33_009539 [Rhypophila sp. PSN 637]
MCLARPFCAVRFGFDDRFLSCLTARMNCNLNSDLADVLELVYWLQPPLHRVGDPRDLIYALLGLTASKSAAIRPDYSLGVKHAFISATRALLSHGFPDILLSFKPCNFPSKVLNSSKLPSWAYDWSARGHDIFGNYIACGDKDTKPVSLSFGNIDLPCLGSRVSERREALILMGRECGSGTATGKAFSVAASVAGIAQQVVYTGNTTLQPPTPSSGASSPDIRELYGHR